MATPGERTSTQSALFEKLATWSASVVAPTVTAELMHPGALVAWACPLFPEAMTVAMPAAFKFSTAAV